MEEETILKSLTDGVSKYDSLCLNDVFVNLKMITKIKNNEKLYINKNLLNTDNSYFQWFTRWYNGEDRHGTVDYISHIINEAFRMCNLIINAEMTGIREENVFDDDNSVVLHRLTHELTGVINGLITMKMTYVDDSLIQSKIDLMLDNINNKIQRNNKLLKMDL